jgi:CRP-like cAMP-binding protein
VRPDPDQLASIPLFASLKPEHLEAIASLSDVREEDPGTELVGEDAAGHALFVLLEGTASVTTGDAALAQLTTGDFFGEIALLGEGRRTATVTATSPVRLLVMHGSDFRVFERDWPEASQLLRQAMAERLARSG